MSKRTSLVSSHQQPSNGPIPLGGFLLLPHGTAVDVSRAKDMVASTQPDESAVHLS